MFIPISIGVMGQVYLTVDEEDVKKVLVKHIGPAEFAGPIR